MTAINNTFSGNFAGDYGGGAIRSTGTTTAINNTFSGNSATDNGGAISSYGTLTATNNIFTGNSTSNGVGGGIYNGETANADSNVFYNNLASSSEDDCNGCTTNTKAVSGDPKLTALGNYGGPTQTMMPQPGSTAICAGAISSDLATDQRGYARTTTYNDTACVDAGAVETNYSLNFVDQPTNGIRYLALSPAPSVQLNESGSAFAYSGLSISVADSAANLTSADSTLSSTTDSTGLATFSNLMFTAAESNDTLIASALPSSQAIASTSHSFTITTLTFSPAAGTLSSGTFGTDYSQSIVVSGGSGSYSYAVIGGSLPAGLSLNSTTGLLSGRLTAGGVTSTFTIKVVDLAATASTANATYSLTVNVVTPIVTWATPSAISYGTALSATQLNATASTDGSFVYIPSTGAILGVGINTLQVTFTPTDTIDYTTVTKTVSLTVNAAAGTTTPTITWATPSAITYGTALSATQLNATANVAGSFVYIPAAGAILGVGTNTLSVTFTPSDTTNYSSVTQTVTLTVTSATTTTAAPTISSLSPANASAGGSAFTLTVTGKNFTSGETVYWGSTALATTYVSETQLTAAVTASQIASSGIVAISVLGSDGTFSSTLLFEIDSTASTAPTFTTTTVTVTAGSTATYAVTLSSTATIASVTCLNLPAGASCSYSATKAVTITTSTATPAGSYPVTIVFTETTTNTTTAGILLPILLLPLLLMRRKLAARGAWFTACLAMLLLAGSILATGCGGASKSTTTNTATTQTTSSGVVTLVVK